ncbi:MAG TPA: ComEC/Rec2 family competence protein [Aggregatilineales bacterium]|nr:ComEC/Rec2 family competence protein [Aggregatilineales bacterium]
MTLITLAAAWLAGILLARAADFPWWVWPAAALPLIAALVLARKQPGWRLVLACGLVLAAGGGRYALSVPRFDETTLATYNGQGFATLEGLVVDRPDVRDTYVALRVEVDSVALEEGPPIAVEGLALVQAPRGGAYRYGDRVRVFGKPETPPEDDDFSYRAYLARQGVYSMVRFARVEPTGERGGSPLRGALIGFRERAHETITRLLPDPQASLLSGILLGIESGISDDVREAFNATGATHVIAISGSNLVILAGVLQTLAARIIKRPGWVAAITIAGITGYAVFVGGDAAVTRAAIMTSLALVAVQLGRQTYGLASLGFAAILMTGINPLTLWDVGFQLSFLATLGLVLYVEPLQGWLERALQRIFSKETARRILAATSDAFIVTLAAQITTTPIMAYAFGRFSLASLPVNLLIVPAQTGLMILGGLGVLAALVWWPLGQVLAWGSWLFLSWTIGVVRLFARLPHASLSVEGIPPLAVWAVYGAMFGLTWVALQPPATRQHWLDALRPAFGTKALALAGLGGAALLFSAAGALPDGRLHVTFVDAGDGTATLIEAPGGRQILVGAGGSGRQLRAALGDALPYWDRRLDVLVLPDDTAAYASALPDVLARYRFDAVLAGEGVEAAVPGAAGIGAAPGAAVRGEDGVTLRVVQAPAGPEDPTPLALLLEYGDVQVLLPGDLTPEAEAALLGAERLQAAVLHVPGAGREATCSEALLAAVSPRVAVVSSDEPHAAVLARLEAAGAAVYRADRHGTVTLTTDGRQVWVSTAREAR